jgi:AraC-like DNA-binding protein
MTGTPDGMTGAPHRWSADLLSDVLGRIRLASAVFLRGEFSEPWGFLSTDAATLCAVVQPGAERLVLFHVAVEGRFRIRLAGGETAEVQAGDAVVLPYCDVHQMGWGDAVAVPIVELVPRPPWNDIVVVRLGGGAPSTRILCGYLHCEDLLFNPILRALPRLIHVRPTSPSAAEWRAASVRYALEQATRPGGGALLAGLPELVLADCLRQYVESVPDEQRGWLAALKQPAVGRALALLHARPAEPWTVASLARQVAVSRSILAERFTDALGVSPMRYLQDWRLQLAADLLRTTDLGVVEIAARVGYDAEAAFSRAFKRRLGVAPSAWRDRPRRQPA